MQPSSCKLHAPLEWWSIVTSSSGLCYKQQMSFSGKTLGFTKDSQNIYAQFLLNLKGKKSICNERIQFLIQAVTTRVICCIYLLILLRQNLSNSGWPGTCWGWHWALTLLPGLPRVRTTDMHTSLAQAEQVDVNSFWGVVIQNKASFIAYSCHNI